MQKSLETHRDDFRRILEDAAYKHVFEHPNGFDVFGNYHPFGECLERAVAAEIQDIGVVIKPNDHSGFVVNFVNGLMLSDSIAFDVGVS